MNSNKKSITLDLKSEDGRQALRRLAATADAVMNNLRGDQPEKLGLDYKSLSAVNPAIVCLHISAYGRDNERKAWPGYDFLMQAEAGLMALTGEPDGPPQRFGSSMIDFLTGMTGMVGLARLHHARAQHRQGLRRRRVACSMWRCTCCPTRHLVHQRRRHALPPAARLAPVGHPGPDRAHQGRLDLCHVHEGEVLGGRWPSASAGQSS